MPPPCIAGNYGLMQIRLGTARGVGYRGDADGLLDPDTNLTYAVKYLAGAYRAAGCDADRAVSYYQRGYYGAARRECGRLARLCKWRKRSQSARAAARSRPSRAAPAPDVIKPKVVRTETIATSKPSRLRRGRSEISSRRESRRRRLPVGRRRCQPVAPKPISRAGNAQLRTGRPCRCRRSRPRV